MKRHFLDKDAEPVDAQKALEALAEKRGVVLAKAAPVPSAPAPAPVATGWLAKTMPVAAAMMVELKEQLGPELYSEALANIKRGKGYVVDLTTCIALGSPPAFEYELGKAQQQDGFMVRRVRPRPAAG